MKRTKHLTRRARIFSPMSRFSEHLAGGTGGNSKKQRTVNILIVIYITIYIYNIYTHDYTRILILLNKSFVGKEMEHVVEHVERGLLKFQAIFPVD